jgi:hypothetical protein
VVQQPRDDTLVLASLAHRRDNAAADVVHHPSGRQFGAPLAQPRSQLAPARIGKTARGDGEHEIAARAALRVQLAQHRDRLRRKGHHMRSPALHARRGQFKPRAAERLGIRSRHVVAGQDRA